MKCFLTVLTLSLCLFSFSSYSQKLISTSARQDWQIQPVHDGTSEYYFSRSNFKRSIAYLSDGAVLGTMLTDKKFALVKLDTNGKEVWQLPVTGRIIGVNRLHNRVIAFYNNDPFNNATKEIRFLIVDPAKGSIIIDKQFTDNKKKKYLELTMHENPEGELGLVLVRTSKWNGKTAMNVHQYDDPLKIQTLEGFKISEDGDISTPISYNSELSDGQFIGCSLSNNGNLFLTGILNKKLIGEYFDTQGNKIGSLSQDWMRINELYYCKPVLSKDKNDANVFYFAVGEYTKLINFRLVKFDFRSNKMGVSDPFVFNKEGFNKIEFSTIPDLNQAKYKHVQYFDPVEIVQYENKLAVVGELTDDDISMKSSVNHAPERSYSHALVVSFLDQDLKLINIIGLDKNKYFYLPFGLSVGIYQKNAKLYITTQGDDIRDNHYSFLCRFDLERMKMEECKTLQHGELSYKDYMEPGATLWFSNRFIVDYVVPKAIILQCDTITEAYQYDYN